jgi:hypothetical protein
MLGWLYHYRCKLQEEQPPAEGKGCALLSTPIKTHPGRRHHRCSRVCPVAAAVLKDRQQQGRQEVRGPQQQAGEGGLLQKWMTMV